MEDSAIIQLYWERSDEAIPATAKKYGRYCAAIAGNILDSREDAEECVNDTYLKAWNAMPPRRPQVLSAFLGAITRNLAFNRYKYNRAGKRQGAILTELSECVSGISDPEQELDRRELLRAINDFLSNLPEKKRNIFVCRYWYSDSVGDIARRYAMREGAVSMTLNRLRADLRRFLTERGFQL